MRWCSLRLSLLLQLVLLVLGLSALGPLLLLSVLLRLGCCCRGFSCKGRERRSSERKERKGCGYVALAGLGFLVHPYSTSDQPRS